MNQINNLVQWKNLSEEDQAGFDFEGFKYDVQAMYDLNWFNASKSKGTDLERAHKVYRLVIEPEKFYYFQFRGDGGDIVTGKYILDSAYEVDCNTRAIRPATEAEIPKPETLEDRVKAEYGDYEVVMLFWANDVGVDFLNIPIREADWEVHTVAQSMRGFAGYVYPWPGEFNTHNEPIKYISGTYTHPIAALFARGGE